ncbi:MAG: glycosyltransferase, partial [Rhodopirellula sp. JB053]
MQIPPQSKIHVVLLVLRLDVGGMERYLANVANGFDRKSFRVSILCLDSAGAAKSWITESDVEILELGMKTGNNLRVVNLITQVLRRIKPDIVHSHNWATLLESYLAVKRFGRAVHVHGERGTVLGTNSCGPIKRAMRAAVMRWICRRIAVTTNSYRVADRVSSITGIPPTQMSVIPNGVSPKHGPDEMQRMRVGVRNELGFGSEDFVIGSVARLCKVKNLGLVDRFGLQGMRMGDVVAGAVIKHSRDFNLTREAVLSCGLAPETPAYDIQQACGTGLEAAILVANKIALGQIECGIAGGTDTTSDAPIGVGEGLR